MINIFKSLFSFGKKSDLVDPLDPDFLYHSNVSLKKELIKVNQDLAVQKEKGKNYRKRIRSLKKNVDKLKNK